MKLAAAGLYGNLNKDPVCGMDVSESKAKSAGRTSEYQRKTYYFCSDSCKKKFESDPQKYIGQPPRMEPMGGPRSPGKERRVETPPLDKAIRKNLTTRGGQLL